MDKFIILRNGKKLPVIKEDGKYLYVNGTQYRENHPDILEVVEEKEEVEKGYENIPDMEEIEKEIATEEKFIENLSTETKSQQRRKVARKGE